MHAIVVYESHWGCTMAVAQAIAEGIGEDARALTTDEATPEAVAGADLVVAGAPVIAFALPRTGATAQLAGDTKAPRPADVSHPLLRTWLEGIPAGHVRFAAVETIAQKPHPLAAAGLTAALVRPEEESKRLKLRIAEVLAANAMDLGDRLGDVSALLGDVLTGYSLHHDTLVRA